MSTNQQVNALEGGRLRPLVVLLCIAFVLQLVGLAGPGWIVVISSQESLYIGIWFAIVCSDSTCMAQINYRSTLDGSTNYWVRYQVLTTSGTAVCLLSIFILTIARRSVGCGKFGFTAFTMAISGACAIAASALVGKDLLNSVKGSEGDSSFKFPWALLLTGIGGIFSAIAVLVSIKSGCQVRRAPHQNQGNNTTTAQQSVPQTHNYLGGYNYNAGYSPQVTGYPPFVHANEAYGATAGTAGNQIYPNLNAYGPNPGNDFVDTTKPITTPSAPPLEFM